MLDTNVCRVKCGDKEITIRIQRPDFVSVESAYREINIVGRIEAEEAYKKHYAETGNKEESDEIYSLTLIKKKYETVGGNAYAQFISDMDKYYNTCALRISYALNYSTHPIKNMKKQVVGRGYKGKDNHTYYLGVFDIIELLKLNWKALSWTKSTYNQVKDKIQCGCSEDFYHNMTSKAENQKFFKELQSIKRKGIVAMIGTDGLRHTTLWNESNFVDVEFNYYNFLDGTNYIIKELYFWDLL
ncbi:MAG: T6SS effector amidase Tae4 family protein [Helicobacter sp.]|uniref:Uncharacterized protein n=3 Tax=Helicobacter TaxID=209 RepID=T1CYU6_9HELI|nr:MULTISPECIES: T6SS effector amidase Tae4 family protein [Helicobacter]EMZ35900.1 hypothetical protein C826_02426 [Helicobacter bilis WiWa]MDY5821594.1 T6SS effector amidase Tae4 family protein [Helicobacter sp.]MDY5950402.1 T6SS effector amidase Tae4 family protein [Helicobacter sp.]TLE02414.1 hypothetical protein LS77_010665 [Helicobacter bilis]TLE03160.1 hypothetical protein LS76_010535 [Helicobacter bilis]